jgi:hypothetical protein
MTMSECFPYQCVSFVWQPLLLIVAGVAHYYWYKFVNPYPEELLRELDQRSFTGAGAYRYRPEAGTAIAIVGVLFFVGMNYTWVMQQFR